jgi:proline iminopeptidase
VVHCILSLLLNVAAAPGGGAGGVCSVRNDVAAPGPGPAPASAFGAHDFHESFGQAADTIGRMLAPTPLRSLYDPASAASSSWLAVPGGHEVHVQQSGAPQGIPAVVLHGGPGSGISPLAPRFFDPQRYRVICIDQRGAGQSRPAGSLANNTTTELLADLHAVRAQLGIERWLVVGGSWGATLALAHALDEPAAVSGLLLRGLFLARVSDIDGFFDAAAHGRPQAWSAFEQRAAAQGVSLIESLHRTLCGDAAEAAALHWWRWEQFLVGNESVAEPDATALAAQVQRLRIQSHYLQHHCWLNAPPLLERCLALPAVPTLLLHGSSDRICPPEGAAAFAALVPHSRWRPIDGAGHDPMHPRMVDAMVRALDHFAARGHFDDEAST